MGRNDSYTKCLLTGEGDGPIYWDTFFLIRKLKTKCDRSTSITVLRVKGGLKAMQIDSLRPGGDITETYELYGDMLLK